MARDATSSASNNGSPITTTTTTTSSSKTLGKRKRITSAEKELAYFLVIDAGLRVTTAAAITDVKYDALDKSIRRERKRRELRPPVRSPEEVARIQERVDRIWAMLESEQKWIQKQRRGST
ncbi:hypothetical protein Gpo141_00007668 [Globisporangium polare]